MADDSYLTALARELGERRLHAFLEGQANVQAMAMCLVLAVSSAPRAGYSDAALTILIADAEDLRRAANEWADWCLELAEAWRAQREQNGVTR